MGGGGAKKTKKISDREARLAEAYRAFKEKQAAQEFDNEGESIGSVVPRKKSKKEKRKVQDVQRDDSGDEGDGETGAHSKAKEAEDAPAKRPKSTPGSGPISAASGCKVRDREACYSLDSIRQRGDLAPLSLLSLSLSFSLLSLSRGLSQSLTISQSHNLAIS